MAKTLAHGIAGGVMSKLNGGRFGNGFISAGITQSFSKVISGVKTSTGRIFAAAAVGGTASELTGGKFSNGAVTGAFSRAFNDEIHIEFEFRAPSILREAINLAFGTDMSGQGGALGLSVSFPGFYGGEFDAGFYLEGSGGGVDLGTGRLSFGVGYGVGSVRDLAGEGAELSFNDGLGGMSLDFDDMNRPVGVGIHVGPGFNGGGAGTVTKTLTVRDAWEWWRYGGGE